MSKYLAAASLVMLSSSAFAADYAAPYQPRVVHRPPPVVYYAPPPLPAIAPAPPVYWVMAPPNYIQHLVPTRGCNPCGPGYAAVGRWHQTLPPGPFDKVYLDYGY
jgi:hypothetical protein